MQGKNYTLLKPALISIAFLISLSLSITAKEKTSQDKDKPGAEKSKGAAIFDSCGKDKADKCGKGSQISVPDYSKSLK